MCDVLDRVERRGEKRGERRGLKRGERQGFRRGERSGFKRGEKRGEMRGENNFAALIRKLTPGSADYEIALNATAEERKALYRKYGIISGNKKRGVSPAGRP